MSDGQGRLLGMTQPGTANSVGLIAALLWLPLWGTAQETRPEPPERGLRLHEEGAFDGYTLFSPFNSTSAFLIDMQGEVVHRWETGLGTSGAVYLLDDGHLLRAARVEDNPRFRGGGVGGRLQKLDWEGNPVWDFVLADDYMTQHHDLEPLPNGNVLVIVWEHRFREDAEEWGRDPGVLDDDGLWPDAILEIRPILPDDGEIVWEWHSWDHMIQDTDPTKPNYGSIPDHPELVDINADHRDQPPLSEEERQRLEEIERQMQALGYVGGAEEEEPADAGGGRQRGAGPDWLHTNSIDYHAELDLILLSVPILSEIWVIDHSASSEEAAWNSGGRWKKGGDLLYRWGNPRHYGRGTDADRQFFYQHDAQWIPGEEPGELRVTIFNNGGMRPGEPYSSVEEIVLPFDREKGFLREAGAAFGPAEPVWIYSDPGNFYSSFISGAQRLPNGNTLICSGAPGRVFEVTRDGEIVWDYLNTLGGEPMVSQIQPPTPAMALFRATRIAADAPALAGRDL